MTARRTRLREFITETLYNLAVCVLVVAFLAAASAIYGGPA